MSKEDLIPVKKGSIEARMLGMKGGLSKSQAKSEAQKWRQIKLRIKSGKLKVDDPEWFLQKCMDSKAFRAQVLADIEEIKKMNLQPMTRVQLINATLKLGEQMHPATQETINYNFNMDLDLLRKRLLDDDNVVDVKAIFKDNGEKENGNDEGN